MMYRSMSVKRLEKEIEALRKWKKEQEAEGESSTASRMPLESPRKPADAFK